MEQFNLTPAQHDKLEDLIYELEFNPAHPDDISNGGGVWACFEAYSPEEQAELIEKAKLDGVEAIAAHPVYKQVLADAYGGIMYDVANRNKYDSKAIIEAWNNLTPAEQGRAGGIMSGAFGFLKGDN